MKKVLLLLSLIYLFSIQCNAQQQDSIINIRLNDYFSNYKNTYVRPQLKAFHVDYDKHFISIIASEEFAYQPFRQQTIDSIYSQIKSVLPGPVRYYDVKVFCNNTLISDFIPNYYRRNSKKDNSRLETNLEYKGSPWIRNISKPFEISHGLQNRYIGLWQSHGKYYNKNRGWLWQRPRLFCTTEDLFSQSFVLPYLIPMLENAGAIVFTPRERDTQKYELIIDNDLNMPTQYIENSKSNNPWKILAHSGFGFNKSTLADGENPFEMGTCKYINTEKKANKASVEWIPDIPVSGKYAVYVSYKTIDKSVTDAHYTVYHKGERTDYIVNQQMGSNTWVYLGTFDFDKGYNNYNKVSLSNESNEDGVITADAVRFGGGMGNVSRNGSTSGMPRYLEGARYYAQWAGMPEKVYNGRNGTDDYADDINTRSLMINYLSGGSLYNPDNKGLNIPFELEMAFHTDAGHEPNNGFIGTLGIYTTNYNNGKLYTGTDRLASRDLCDIVLSNIKSDIDNTYNIDWQRRAMWDRNYSESRVPAVPSTIIEMLSHQNFQDMRYALDPNFKFTLSRAIYKGILRFITSQHKTDYQVQPLPISHFAIDFGKKKRTITLSWQGENDALEETARPNNYIVYQKIEDSSFDNGTIVNGTEYTLKPEPGKIYSFYVTAVNKGGESFPSETLSAMIQKKVKEKALIVNGFDRLSAPYIVDNKDSLGFDLDKDPGVAYQQNISFCGHQICYDRTAAGKEGEGSLGYSNGDLEGQVVAGNTFNYPYIHGKAIQSVGKWSFVSCSRKAFESIINDNETLVSPKNIDKIAQFRCIDLIMGLQKQDSNALYDYKIFTQKMKNIIKSYSIVGGHIIVSGAYLGRDNNDDKIFCNNVLKFGLNKAISDNDSTSAIYGNNINASFIRKINDKFYPVTTPEIISYPKEVIPIMNYSKYDDAAVTLYDGKDYKVCVMGFPFESLIEADSRNSLMNLLLRTFEKK
jgi:hypothetical protein